jgi:NAD(P)-dependent dehydrogenase (short-subunit alcohol dehydrogenase family)
MVPIIEEGFTTMTAAFRSTESDFPEAGCAVVFGGSGGIGAATADWLAWRGCDVVVTYGSRRAEAEQLANTLVSRGRGAIAVACDITDSASTQSVVDAALSRYGRVHTVITATGPHFDTAPLADLDADTFIGVVRTDVIGFFNVARATVPALRSGGGGSIVAVIASSIERTVPTNAMSATPKSAVAMMIRQLAAEEGRNGIRANAVGPGIVDGGMVRAMRHDPAIEGMLQHAVQSIPLGRLGRTEEIAEAIGFLASSKASFITGQLLMVDGGHTA